MLRGRESLQPMSAPHHGRSEHPAPGAHATPLLNRHGYDITSQDGEDGILDPED